MKSWGFHAVHVSVTVPVLANIRTSTETLNFVPYMYVPPYKSFDHYSAMYKNMRGSQTRCDAVQVRQSTRALDVVPYMRTCICSITTRKNVRLSYSTRERAIQVVRNWESSFRSGVWNHYHRNIRTCTNYCTSTRERVIPVFEIENHHFAQMQKFIVIEKGI